MSGTFSLEFSSHSRFGLHFAARSHNDLRVTEDGCVLNSI